jgi:hypothetical protein
MDIDEKIRFQILSEEFTDTTPTPANIGPAGRRQSAADTTAINDLAANSTKIAPYSLTVSASMASLTLQSAAILINHCRELLLRMVLDSCHGGEVHNLVLIEQLYIQQLATSYEVRHFCNIHSSNLQNEQNTAAKYSVFLLFTAFSLGC